MYFYYCSVATLPLIGNSRKEMVLMRNDRVLPLEWIWITVQVQVGQKLPRGIRFSSSLLAAHVTNQSMLIFLLSLEMTSQSLLTKCSGEPLPIDQTWKLR